MATSSKRPSKASQGLLYGPSRKKSSWETERTGTAIDLTERHTTIPTSGDINTAAPGTTTTTILSIDPSNIASLTYLQLIVRATGTVNRVEIQFDDTRSFLILDGTPETILTFSYQEAIRFKSTVKVVLAAGGAATPALSYNLLHIVEPITDTNYR